MIKAFLRRITALFSVIILLVSVAACAEIGQGTIPKETPAPSEEASVTPTETQDPATQPTETQSAETQPTEEPTTEPEPTEATVPPQTTPTQPQVSAPVHSHSYVGATCTQGGTCSCGAVSAPLGHSFSTVTCVSPAVCSRCGLESGEATGHTYSGGKCTKCGDTGGPLTPWEASLFRNQLTDEQNAQALAVARQIANSIPTDISDLERVSMAATRVSYYYNPSTHTETGAVYSQAYGVFIAGSSSCAGCTRALGLVLTLMGYSWTHVNENQYTHQWCRLTMDGEVGYADGQVGWAGYGPHPAE